MPLYKLANFRSELRVHLELSLDGTTLSGSMEKCNCSVVLARNLLHWSMLPNLDEGEGSVGDVLLYDTGEVLGKTSSPGRSKLQTVTWLYDWICADIVLSQEAIMKLCKAVKPKLALSDKTESLVAFPNLRIRNCIHLPEIAKVRIYVRSGSGKEGPMRTNQNRVWPNWQRFHKKKDGKLQKNASFSNSNSKSKIRHSFKCFQN